MQGTLRQEENYKYQCTQYPAWTEVSLLYVCHQSTYANTHVEFQNAFEIPVVC